MNTDELKKLAEAATPIYTELYGDRYFRGPFSYAALNKEQDAYIAAANPAAILKLLAINAELVEMVKEAAVLADFAECWITDPAIDGISRLKGKGDKFRAALAKAEGGEL